MDAASEANLQGVHPDLVKVVRAARDVFLAMKTDPLGFKVVDGLRTLTEQKENLARGASQTLRSRHLTGHAVDVMATLNGRGVWEPATLYQRIAAVMQHEADLLGVKIIWGGSWKTLKDFGHFELDRSKYP